MEDSSVSALPGKYIQGGSMKYFLMLLILFPMIVSAQEKVSVPPSSSKGGSTSGPTGYKTKDCDNKCTKDQQCTLNDDEKYYCTILKGYSDKNCSNKCSENQTCQLNVETKRYFCADGATPKPLEVYISCKTVGGVFKGSCSSDELAVYAVQGKNQILIREHRPGQCCISKSKLKVY
jgi:hypothetical protein